MAEKNVFEKLAGMISEEDMIGQPVTPSFIRMLSLQFTEDEAEMALKIRLSGGTLEELSAKLDMDKDQLYAKLMHMADKGTIMYKPSDENPVYRCAGMTAGGLTETGAWGGIRFPNSAELIREMQQVIKEHAEGGLAKIGVPYTPVWAGMLALPDDVKPSENIAEAVKEAGHWSVSKCPCRLSRAISTPEDHCDHMLETCIHTGELSIWAVKHGMARELSYEELVERLKEVNEDGLVHTINLSGIICNCCEDCCAIFHAYKIGAPTFIPSPFVAKSDADLCTRCGTCAERCPVDAITVDDFALVDEGKCIGCGVCVPKCSDKAIRLVRRTPAE